MIKSVKHILAVFFSIAIILSAMSVAFATDSFYEYTPPKWATKYDSYSDIDEGKSVEVCIWKGETNHNSYQIALDIREIDKNSLVITENDASIPEFADQIVEDARVGIEDYDYIEKVTEKHDYSVEKIGNYLALRINAIFTSYSADNITVNTEMVYVMYTSANHVYQFGCNSIYEENSEYVQDFIDSLNTFTINEELADNSYFGLTGTDVDKMITNMVTVLVISLIIEVIGVIRRKKKTGAEFVKDTKNFTGFEE